MEDAQFTVSCASYKHTPPALFLVDNKYTECYHTKAYISPVRGLMTPRFCSFLLVWVLLAQLSLTVLRPHSTQAATRSSQLTSLEGGVQGFLERRGSGLATLEIDATPVAQIIEHVAWYYNVEVRILLALLETTSGVVEGPAVTQAELERPFGAGPQGFIAQIDWAAREVRAAFGPYDRDPLLTFRDGSQTRLRRTDDQHGMAIRRFLALGRTQTEWNTAVEQYPVVYETLFKDEPVASPPTPPVESGFLSAPWIPGTRVIHSSYFDHAYPMVDDGGDGNDIMVNYQGHTGLSYNGHDGHDYYFPDQPFGTPLLAAASGWAYARTTRGLGVVIQHSGAAAGYETVYWHLQDFAPVFKDAIDGGTPLWVEQGDLLGWSGDTGFTDGAPHLHFEVRHNGKQVDPYGWYGPGTDPCVRFSRCEASIWLWDTSVPWERPHAPSRPDTTPPTALLTINAPEDILLQVGFEAGALAGVGPLPASDELVVGPGRWGQAGRVGPDARLSYPLSSTLDIGQGSVAMWVDVPESWSKSSTGRHYLLATSANPADDTRIYSGTFALRHEQKGLDDQPGWTFWTVSNAGVEHKLEVADSLEPGWHHFALTWNAQTGSKTMFIDGQPVAEAADVSLPAEVGHMLEVGRWTFGAGESRVWLDELVSYGRVLTAAEIVELAEAEEPLQVSATTTSKNDLALAIPADDDGGGVVQVQLGINGVYASPMPYHRSFRWLLPAVEETYTISVRLSDRLGNTTTLTQPITINQPPVGSVELQSWTALTATLALTATDRHTPLEMALSASANPRIKPWEALKMERVWGWLPMQPRRIYVWFRDASGEETGPFVVGPDAWRVYLPRVVR